jgi:hypothetical protein
MSLLSRLLRFHGGTVRLEDFFTEVFAYLLAAYPELCLTWLYQSEVLSNSGEYSRISVTTQRSFDALASHLHSSRPDVVIELFESIPVEAAHDQWSEELPVTPTDVVFIESKVGSREGQDQLKRYAEQLSAIPDVRRRKLVYITRSFDPKHEDEGVGGLRGSDTPVEYLQLRWHGFYRALEDYRSKSLPNSDLIQEVLLFMKQNGMSQTNRLSAADVVALSGMTKMLAFMRETLSGEVEARIREVSGSKLQGGGSALRQLATFDRYFYYAYMGSEFWVGGDSTSVKTIPTTTHGYRWSWRWAPNIPIEAK